MELHVDEEVQGFNKEFENPNDMRAAVLTLIDENVTEVSIKKRAVKDNSHVNSDEDEIDEAVERFINQ